jgi:hypothetical protein
MDKIQKASMFAGANDNPTQKFKKIIEINPHHKVNQIILERINVLIMLFRTTKLMNNYKNLFNFYMKLPHLILVSVLKIPILLLKDFIKFTQKLWVLLIYKEIKYKFKILNFNKKITNLKLKQ